MELLILKKSFTKLREKRVYVKAAKKYGFTLQSTSNKRMKGIMNCKVSSAKKPNIKSFLHTNSYEACKGAYDWLARTYSKVKALKGGCQ